MNDSNESQRLQSNVVDYGSNHLLVPNTNISANVGAPAVSTIKKVPSGKLNTFNGVFVPTSLNVLSILMFLRFGFIVGQMGVLGSLGLLLLSALIDSLTVMSVSAIATNGTVKGGGAYYMISRSLGPEFGGAIGVIFYFGQILNSSMNVVGFIEPLLVNFGKLDGDLFQLLPVGYYWQLLYSTLLLAFCTMIALTGSGLVSKTALWLFVILVISTISIPLSSLYRKQVFYDEIYTVGISWDIFKENLLPHFTKGAAGSVSESPETFRNLFGIFFPATAGIYAGASMSGELKNPSKSIPLGTIRGLLLTFSLYTIVILSIGWSIPRLLLHKDIKVIQTVNLQSYIIIMGELSTSLFSVIMGLVGAASLLTAISNDKIIPGLSIFATKDKKSTRQIAIANFLAVFITWFLAQLFLFSDINQIAVFVTMAYLMTFIVTNLACFLLKLGSAPNFRPSFKYFSIQTAFLGLIFSTLAMFIVDGMSASFVIILLFILIVMIHYSTPASKFGDISQLLIYHQVRKYLLRLKVNMNVKYWRPQILLLVDSPRSSWNLIGFCNHLKKGGLYILGHVVILSDDTTTNSDKENDKDFSITAYKEVQKQKNAWVKLRDMAKIKGFVQIALGPSLPWGVRNVYLGSGLGGMKPNITVLGFYDYVKHGFLLHLSSFNNKSQFEQLPTDDCREEQKVSINQWVQIIEDLIIMQSSVAVAANFNNLKLPKVDVNQSFWARMMPKRLNTTESKKYIDLYPIQMSSINVVDGKSILSTNFDTYTLILQLGSILATVPEWKYTLHRLRVIVFVEEKEEVEEERKRLTSLLATLRIDAKVKAICLNDGSLNSYNYIVKGWSKNPSNKFEYEKIDKILKPDQWWKNLCSARETMTQIEKNKLKKQKWKVNFVDDDFKTLGLHRSNSQPSKAGKKRRETISNLEQLGLSLSFNMKGGMQDYTKVDVDSSSSSEEDDESYNISTDTLDDENWDYRFQQPVPQQLQPQQQPLQQSQSTRLKYQFSRSRPPMKLDLSNRLAAQVSTDQLSVKSSRSNLRPNFVSIKTPTAQINDEDDDEGAGDDDGIGKKPSIGFVEDNVVGEPNSDTTTPIEKAGRYEKDYFALEIEKKKKSTSKLKQEANGLRSPSIISNDGIIHQLRTPQFLTADDGDDDNIPSISSSTVSIPKLASPKATTNTGPSTRKSMKKSSGIQSRPESPSATSSANDEPVITQKQLQQELKELSFDEIPAKGQHIILNELMKLNSPADQTDVIFSTLPAPSINTHLNDEESFDYTNNLSIWLHELPPVILFNSQTITVTTAL